MKFSMSSKTWIESWIDNTFEFDYHPSPLPFLTQNSKTLRDSEEEENIIYLEDMEEFDTDSEDKDVKKYELYISLTFLVIFYWTY